MTSNRTPNNDTLPPPPQPFEVTVARKLDALSSSLLETFLRLDVDRDGYVTRSDLKTALHNVLGIDLSPEQMDAIFVRFAYFEDESHTSSSDESSSNAQAVHHGIRYQEFVRYMDATAKQRLSMAVSRQEGSTLLDTKHCVRKSDFKMFPIVLTSDMERSKKRQALLRLLRAHEENDTDVTRLFLEMDTHRSGRVAPNEFCNWVNSKIGQANLLTPSLLKELLGPNHYKPEGMTQQEFSVAMYDLANEDFQLGTKEIPFEEDDEETASHHDEKAREHYHDALVECVDNSKSDVELVREVAEQLFVRRVKLVDAFRKYDLDGTGRLSAEELCKALEEAADLHISVDRAQSLVDKFDLDGDGKLSKGEFVRLIASSSNVEKERAPTPQKDDETTSCNKAEDLRQSLVASVVGHEEQDQHLEIASRLDEDDIRLLLSFRQALEDERIMASKIFQSMDKDRSKALTAQELKDGFEKMGVQISQDHIDRIMIRFETGGTGKMKYHQFVKLLSTHLEA